MTNRLWTQVLHLLQAIATAGSPPSARAPQLYIGPNGAMVWNHDSLAERSEIISDSELVPIKVPRRRPIDISPAQPAPGPIDAGYKDAA